MAAILFVRVKSNLDEEELDRQMVEGRPKFHNIPDLVQKIYGRDKTTDSYCGIYFSKVKNYWQHFVKPNWQKRFLLHMK